MVGRNFVVAAFVVLPVKEYPVVNLVVACERKTPFTARKRLGTVEAATRRETKSTDTALVDFCATSVRDVLNQDKVLSPGQAGKGLYIAGNSP